MYLDKIANAIQEKVPEGNIPVNNSSELFRLYAILVRVKGNKTTNSDVHDVWSAWMSKYEPDHVSLIDYKNLDEDIKQEDRIFVKAIHKTADELDLSDGVKQNISDVLFPSGPPKDNEDINQTFQLYKIMVDSSESLVSRRQGVNTFFLTMNGALLTASGVIVKSSGGDKLGGIGIAVLALAGAILCGAWRSLIVSFGQLNSGKFKVINTIEKYLKTSIYAAEWEALESGKNPKVYRSFTSREIWVPILLLGIHILTAIAAALFVFGVINFGVD